MFGGNSVEVNPTESRQVDVGAGATNGMLVLRQVYKLSDVSVKAEVLGREERKGRLCQQKLVCMVKASHISAPEVPKKPRDARSALQSGAKSSFRTSHANKLS